MVSEREICSITAFKEQLATAAPKRKAKSKIVLKVADDGGRSGRHTSKMEWSSHSGLRCHLQRSGSAEAQQGTREFHLCSDKSSFYVCDGNVTGSCSRLSSVTLAAVSQITRLSNKATAGWCREPWRRLNNCSSRPLQSLNQLKPKQKKAVLPRMTGRPVSCLAVSGKGVRQQSIALETDIVRRLGTQLAAHAAAAKACSFGHKKEDTAYAAICQLEQAARGRRQRGL